MPCRVKNSCRTGWVKRFICSTTVIVATACGDIYVRADQVEVCECGYVRAVRPEDALEHMEQERGPFARTCDTILNTATTTTTQPPDVQIGAWVTGKPSGPWRYENGNWNYYPGVVNFT